MVTTTSHPTTPFEPPGTDVASWLAVTRDTKSRDRIPRPFRIPLLGTITLRHRGAISLLITACALFSCWATMAPQQLGGPLSFAITDGVSMLPNYHAGDLVVLRKEPSYHVGEVAAYHNAQLHVVVMHRIVAIRGKKFIFKGDNNAYPDNYEPNSGQIVGAEWIHLAGWGRLIRHLRDPYVAAFVFAMVWILSFRLRADSRRRRRRCRRAE